MKLIIIFITMVICFSLYWTEPNSVFRGFWLIISMFCWTGVMIMLFKKLDE
jgi:hypothetical protein